MKRLGRLRRVVAASPISSIRLVVERAVTANLRRDLEAMHRDVTDALHRVACRVDELERSLADIEEHQPPLMNAVASVNGNARITRRELATIREQLTEIERQITASADLVGSPD